MIIYCHYIYNIYIVIRKCKYFTERTTYSDSGEDLVEADMVPSVEVRAGAQGRQGQGGLKTGGAGGTLRQRWRPGRVVGWFASG